MNKENSVHINVPTLADTTYEKLRMILNADSATTRADISAKTKELENAINKKVDDPEADRKSQDTVKIKDNKVEPSFFKRAQSFDL